jgi:hypothetical protein
MPWLMSPALSAGSYVVCDEGVLWDPDVQVALAADPDAIADACDTVAKMLLKFGVDGLSDEFGALDTRPRDVLVQLMGAMMEVIGKQGGYNLGVERADLLKLLLTKPVNRDSRVGTRLTCSPQQVINRRQRGAPFPLEPRLQTAPDTPPEPVPVQRAAKVAGRSQHGSGKPSPTLTHQRQRDAT